MMFAQIKCMAIVISLATAAPPSEAATPPKVTIQFQKLADSSTHIPGTDDVFQDFEAPSVSGENVAFIGRGPGATPQSSMSYGVYAVDQSRTLRRIADQATPVPNGSGEVFAALDEVQMDGSDIVFRGQTQSFRTGVYRSRQNNLAALVDWSTLTPAGQTHFEGIRDLAYRQGTLVFIASDEELVEGVYRLDAEGLKTLATESTIAPGTNEPFSFFGSIDPAGGVAVAGSESVFIGHSGVNPSGVYLTGSAGLTVIADSTITPPGGIAPFSFDLGQVAATAQQICIRGSIDGIYRWKSNAPLEPVVTYTTPLPGDAAPLSFIDTFAVSGSNTLAVRGSRFQNLGLFSLEYQPGIYADLGSDLIPIVKSASKLSIQVYLPGFGYVLIPIFKFGGDQIDGKTIQDVSISSTGMDAGSIGMRVKFTNGSSGIYLAKVASN